MRKYKLCLGTNDQFGLPNSEQIALFKETGFDAFFMGYCGKDSVSEARVAADKNNMIFQSVHAPFGRMNEMWAEGIYDSSSLTIQLLFSFHESIR